MTSGEPLIRLNGITKEYQMGAEIVRALRGLPLKIHNDGSQIRAWCHVEDILRGTLMVLEDERAIGQSFNIGNARSTVTIARSLVPQAVGAFSSKTPLR